MLHKLIHYVILTTILACFAATAYPMEITRQPAGNAGDKNPGTFKFSSTNADRQLTKKDGLPISRQNVRSIYNTNGSSTTGDGMRIYDNSIDVCSLEYANLENRKRPVGMDLSDMADWQNISINPGEVGIDPTLGRFKFSTGKAGTVTVVGRYIGSGESYCGVYTNGNYAYLGEGSSGMYILDISNPQSPKKVGKYSLGGIVNGLAGDDRYIYLINYRSDLGATSVRIVDVSNPGTPTTAGNFGVSSRVYDIYPAGNYVFVAHISGLRVVDVSDPKKPFDRGTYEQDSRNTVYGVYVRGDYAYLAHASTGLKILDVSDPSSLKEVGQCRLTSYKVGSQPYAVYVSGNYAYLSYGAGGLQIIDVSEPKSPVLVGKYDESLNDESVYKTYVRGNYAYAISYKKDSKLFNVYVMRVIDISNPKEPRLIQKYTENIGKPIFDSYDISLSKGLAYVTDASNMMRVLEIPIASELPLGSVTVDYNYTVEPLRIILTSPNGGETLSGKSSNNITWNTIGGVPPYKVNLYYSTDSGKTFDNTIVTDMPMPSFPWTVPGTNTLNLRVKVVITDTTGAMANDMSDGDVQVDYIQPLVTKTNILDGGKDILLDSSLIITFSEPMNQVMTQQAITIFPDIPNKTFGWSEDKKQLTITHSGFNENISYVCTISTEARDITSPGNRLKDVYRWSFKTIVPPPGSISVTSNIKNASVFLDGILAGTGSLTIGDVGVGSHTLNVQKVNYHPWQQIVFVQSKQTASIHAILTPTIETSLFLDTQGEGSVGVGETFTVSIRVEKAVHLTNMDLFISFDPELLEVLEIKDTAFIPKIASRYGTGSISYAAGVMNGSITGNGTIAEVVFMAKNKGEAVLSFDIDEGTNRKTSLISGVNELPFIQESKNITIAEFGKVNGYAVIDIPRIGTYSGICVDVPETGLKTITDAAGHFLLKRIPPGRVDICASGSGLAPDMWRDIEVVGQQTTTIGTITLINGDADGDGRVNTMDFSLLREAYFKTKDDAGWLNTGTFTRNGYINADLNGDDRVNTEDFAILRDNYFKAVGGSKQLAPMLAAAVLTENNTANSQVEAGKKGEKGEKGEKIARMIIELPQDMNKIKVKAEFPVRIKVENVSSMSSMDFFLAFDPAILSVNRIQGNAFLPQITSSIKNSAGFVSHAAGLMTGSAEGSGTIATVYFVLNKQQNTKIEFIVDKLKNRETLLMSTGRKVIPWTGEPAILLFDSNTSIPARDSVATTTAVATILQPSAFSLQPGSITTTLQPSAFSLQPGSMTQVANLKPDGMSYGIFLQNNHAYMSCESGGVQIIDVSNPSSPVLAGKYDTPALCRDTYVAGNYAYVADGTGGLVILDVSDVVKPVLVSKTAIDGFCHDAAVSGNYVYLAAAQVGLQIVDISKPQTPKKVGKYKTADIARGVCIRDGYAFVAVGTKGLQIIDISNPYGPKLIGSCDTPSNAYDIWLNGKHAYIADYSGGLQIIDVSNPAKPCIIGSYKTNGYAWDVMVKDNLVFVVCEAAGLYVVNVIDPAHPALAGKIDTGGKAFGVAVGDGYIFVADDYQGLKVIKAEGIGQTTEDRPQIIADRPQTTEGVATKITVSDGLVKMGDMDRGGSTQTVGEAGSVIAGNRPGTGGATADVATKTTMVGKPTTVSSAVAGSTTAANRPGTGGATADVATKTTMVGKPVEMDGRDSGNGKQTADPTMTGSATGDEQTTDDTRSIFPIDDYILPDVLVDTWSLSLAVSADNQVGSIRFGMDPYSTDGFDDWIDMPLPPPPSQDKYLQIYFPHPEWGLVFDRFSADIRSMNEDTNRTEKAEWVFEVQTNMPQGTKMSLSLIDTVEDTGGDVEAKPPIIDSGVYLISASEGTAKTMSQGAEVRSQKPEVSGQLTGIVPEIARLRVQNPASSQKIILTDEETGQVWDMNKENTITFIVDNDGLKRFRLSYTLPVTGKKFLPGWHMVSAPVETPWFPVDGYVYEYGKMGYNITGVIESGRGYWLGVSKETTINLRINERIRDEVAIPLNTGWNMIGCPFTSTLDWSMTCIEKDGVRKGLKESVEAGLVNGTLYKFADGSYKIANSIEPWEGYWFAALTDCRLIILNTVVSGQWSVDKKDDVTVRPALLKSPVARDAVSTDRWQVSLHVSADRYQDTANGAPCLGVNPNSSTGLDSFDRLELPEPQGNFVTLRFVYPDEDASPFNQFDWDIKPPADSIAWEFEVKSNLLGERIAITWDKEDIPQGYYLMLIDKDTGTSMVMDKEGGYAYVCGSNNSLPARHFMVRAIKAAPMQVQDEKAENIDNFSQLKIWPNPATKPSMNFSWGQGKATIRIFTLSGELIRTMPDVDSLTAAWDMKNNDSQPVSSGVYLFVISNAADRRCGKLAVIR